MSITVSSLCGPTQSARSVLEVSKQAWVGQDVLCRAAVLAADQVADLAQHDRLVLLVDEAVVEDAQALIAPEPEHALHIRELVLDRQEEALKHKHSCIRIC